MNEVPRTVQQYIDQAPAWPDGTPTVFVPMTAMQWRIWLLASAGKFFEGLIVFMTGVALPLIVDDLGLGPAEKGLVSAAPLAGIMVGALALGGLADLYGRRFMFVVEMAVLALFLLGLTWSPGLPWLLVFLLGVGLALGGDYPTAHLIISESIASRDRGKLVLGAFAFQAVGALAGTVVGFVILSLRPEIGAWRWMYATAIVPAAVVMLGRLTVSDSVHWLMSQGRRRDAEAALARLLKREPPYPKSVRLADGTGGGARPTGGRWRDLFVGPARRATILASVPWFLQDLGTYGIGIFTPTILAHTIGGHGGTSARNVSDLVASDLLAARGAALLDILLIAGIVAAVLLADRVGRIRLQVVGFVGCAVGLGLAALSQHADGAVRTILLFSGFILFNFMTNVGPNAQTYLLAGEVFPTALRGKGAGIAASFAKVGAVLTAFLFPVILADAGVDFLMTILIVTSLLGAWVTWLFRIETAGIDLETLGR